jgi:hypothetical protein
MDPPSDLEQENAALLAERAALKRRVAELTARRAELEQRLAKSSPEQAAIAVGPYQATDLEGAPRAKEQPDPGEANKTVRRERIRAFGSASSNLAFSLSRSPSGW